MSTRRLIDIESLADFDAHRQDPPPERMVRPVGRPGPNELARCSRSIPVAPSSSAAFAPGVEDHLRTSGALLFPRLPDLPFDPYRGRAYDAAELYGTGDYATSLDAKVYTWAHARRTDSSTAWELGTTFHDHSITDALDDLTSHLELRNVVGIMGGHTVARTDDTFRAAAELGASVTKWRSYRAYGGPGAMEAANSKAYLSPWPDSLDEALTIMKPAPSYRPSLDLRGPGTPSCGPAGPSPTQVAASASPPGSTVTSRPTFSPPISPSTSRMRCGKTLCCIAARVAWLSRQAGTCRKSSKPSQRTSMLPMRV